jgi:hypothetical protein
MHNRPITVAETTLFIRQTADIWSDEEQTEFINFIALNPEMGDLIRHSGGARKLRWSRRDAGKRGGVRVIYFWDDSGMPIYLLTNYAKAVRDNLSPEASRVVQSLVARLKRAYGR